MAKRKRVKHWFARLKGSEFMDAESGSADVFVHYSTDNNSDKYQGLREPSNNRDGRRRNRR